MWSQPITSIPNLIPVEDYGRGRSSQYVRCPRNGTAFGSLGYC